jgi:Oxidoreductase family, NAD-binding Rossmann fold
MNDTNSLANPKQRVQIADFGERVLVNQNQLASELNPHYDLMRREKNNLKQIKALAEWNRVVPFAPCATSDRMGWEGVQAVYYRESPASEVNFPPVSQHVLVLMIRPPEKFYLRYEGVKRDMRPPAGSIAVVPAYSSVLCRWQGRKDSLLIYLEPSLVERVAAESFQLDPTLSALPEFEITAVGTSRQETADETAKHFGIPHAFADPYKMLQQPDVDLVSICVRVPFHHQLGMAPGSRRGFLSTSRSSTCGWLKAFTKESPSAQTSIWPSNATSCLTRFRRRRTPGSARFSSDDRPTASRPED